MASLSVDSFLCSQLSDLFGFFVHFDSTLCHLARDLDGYASGSKQFAVPRHIPNGFRNVDPALDGNMCTGLGRVGVDLRLGDVDD